MRALAHPDVVDPRRSATTVGLLGALAVTVAVPVALSLAVGLGGSAPAKVLGVVALLPALVAAVCDARTGRLPDIWVAATAVVATIAALGSGSGWAIAIASIGATGVPLTAHLAAPGSIGFGDVKAVAALAPAVGAVAATTSTKVPASTGVVAFALAVWLTTSFAAGALVGVVGRRRHVRLGPPLTFLAAVVMSVSIVPSVR